MGRGAELPATFEAFAALFRRALGAEGSQGREARVARALASSIWAALQAYEEREAAEAQELEQWLSTTPAPASFQALQERIERVQDIFYHRPSLEAALDKREKQVARLSREFIRLRYGRRRRAAPTSECEPSEGLRMSGVFSSVG